MKKYYEQPVANKEIADKVGHLYSLLENLKTYENFQEIYEELSQKRLNALLCLLLFRKTKKRRRAFAIANMERDMLKKWYENTDIDKLKNELDDYEKIIDRKFWNLADILSLQILLRSDKAKSIEEACQMYDEFKK